jgi:pyruvate,orthophosphate dikinase
VYSFGGGTAEGKADMKELLGGKGANLAEMANLGLPVPPGFSITTEVCTLYYKNNRKYPAELDKQVWDGMKKIEKVMGYQFGDPANPLLVSIRSGARASMPGMMETILNAGLTSATIPGMIAKTNNPRFVYDAYRRLIMMYSDVVMEKAAGIEPAEGQGIRRQLEGLMADMKKARGVEKDTDLSADDLKTLCEQFKDRVVKVLGKPFPDTAADQLWGSVSAVFQSWNGRRAIEYRRIEKIPDEWGTAVNVQAMVFGNMGDTSATGVGFTRDPSTGRNIFYGEWLPNAQGEDVVAGIRTPLPVNEAGKTDHTRHLESLEEAMPAAYKQLNDIQRKLEKHYRDMLDIEFTIQEGRLWMLQCRVGKRNGVAAVKMAVDMAVSKLITAEEAVLRVKPDALVQVLLPMVDPKAERDAKAIAKGLPAGPGGAHGRVVFTAKDAVAQVAALKDVDSEKAKVILVREETNPEDIDGMHVAQAILTAKGGMTSHAALVARGWGRCCIVGCAGIEVDFDRKEMHVGGKVIKEGDWITLNGTQGLVYEGKLPLVTPDLQHNKEYVQLMKMVDKFRQLGIRTNADTPKDAAKAISFGAEGIGLFRTEHMFYGENSAQPLFLLRKMIASGSVDERRKALDELFPFMKADMKATMVAMQGFPVTIRLLDPPLHEFIPTDTAKLQELANSLGISLEQLEKRAAALHENNPMMGHRGVRLGITYPEVTECQARAILEAAAELAADKSVKNVLPEIMIPVTCDKAELDDQKKIIDRIAAEVKAKYGLKKFDYMVGTMIEIPRACLVANKMAETAEFFSFGTNDLTQMSFGFSRDDIGSFLPDYLKKKVLPEDPFQSLDQGGVGQLIQMGIERGRSTRNKLKIGICGEHGGDYESVKFCHRVGMNYVSCSPFRVPIARLAAAHAAIDELKAKAKASAKKPAAKKVAKKVAKKPAAKKAKKGKK